jgi:hypothetical protein
MLFSDGTKWTNLDWRYPSHDEEPSGPVVSGRGGGGGGDEWEMGYWVWPLPPEGEMTFVASWPLRNIPEQRATVDASELRHAPKTPRSSGRTRRNRSGTCRSRSVWNMGDTTRESSDRRSLGGVVSLSD